MSNLSYKARPVYLLGLANVAAIMDLKSELRPKTEFIRKVSGSEKLNLLCIFFAVKTNPTITRTFMSVAFSLINVGGN